MKSMVLDYYSKRFNGDFSAAFIHLIREIGQIAFALEQENTSVAQTKITEAIALLLYMSSKYEIDIEQNIKTIYSKKLESLTKK